jgi:hypothetical protein
MEKGINLSRFKIYISNIFKEFRKKPDMLTEIAEFKKTRKNIASIITTNYDCLIEEIFEFYPLIGNNILLSNPYGSVYKIHGCVSDPSKIVITQDDYQKFDRKYELIKAQLLSIFIHNPIIFIGYGIGDTNIKKLLKTIFTYVDPNSEDALKIRNNFLLVEYKKDSISNEVIEHDIDIEGFSTIKINKIKTDDFREIYRNLSSLVLPISAMDVRKVQNIVREIYSGGDIEVNITEDLEELNNSDKIIAIGSKKTVKYEFQNKSEMLENYFKIIDESNSQILGLINKYSIQSNQWFPVFGFSSILKTIDKVQELKKNQKDKLNRTLDTIKSSKHSSQNNYTTIKEIYEDATITPTNKLDAIFWAVMNDTLPHREIENHLREYKEKKDTPYRKLLCAYDYKVYGDS